MQGVLTWIALAIGLLVLTGLDFALETAVLAAMLEIIR